MMNRWLNPKIKIMYQCVKCARKGEDPRFYDQDNIEEHLKDWRDLSQEQVTKEFRKAEEKILDELRLSYPLKQ